MPPRKAAEIASYRAIRFREAARRTRSAACAEFRDRATQRRIEQIDLPQRYGVAGQQWDDTSGLQVTADHERRQLGDGLAEPNLNYSFSSKE